MGANVTRDCINCGATVTSYPGERCDRCGAAPDSVAGAIVVLTGRAREIDEPLGGLMRLFSRRDKMVKWVGPARAGAFGIDSAKLTSGRRVRMNREEGIALLARFELGKLSPEDRAAHVETALGEGLLEGQPALAGVANEAGNQAIDQVILDTLRRKC